MKTKQVTHEKKITVVSRHLRVWGKEDCQTLMRWVEARINLWCELPESKRDRELFCLLCAISPAVDPKDLGLKHSVDVDVSIPKRIKELRKEFFSIIFGNLRTIIENGDIQGYKSLIADLCGLGDFLKIFLVKAIVRESNRVAKTDAVMAFALGRTAVTYMAHTGALESPEAQDFVERMNKKLKGHLFTLLKYTIKHGKEKSALIIVDMLEHF